MNIKVLLIVSGDWKNDQPLPERDASLGDKAKLKSILSQGLENKHWI